MKTNFSIGEVFNKNINFTRVLQLGSTKDLLTTKNFCLEEAKKNKLDILYFEDTIFLENNMKLVNKIVHLWDEIKEDTTLSSELRYICVVENVLSIEIEGDTQKIFKSLLQVINEITENEGTMDENRLKNFIAKQLVWFYQYFIKNNKVQEKLVFYSGNIKIHEFYFLRLLYLYGLNVIYINTSVELFDQIDKKDYAKKVKLTPMTLLDKLKGSLSVITTEVNAVASILINKSEENAVQELSEPLSVGSSIINAYFCISTGVSDIINIDNYYNSIYLLDKELSTGNYLRLEGTIMVPALPEVSKYCMSIFEKHQEDISSAVEEIIMSDVFKVRDEAFNTLCRRAFVEVVDRYFSKHQAFSKDKKYNFIAKIVAWFMGYAQHKYKKQEQLRVLFYGKIKEQEIYFLLFLHLTGADIIYINSEKGCNQILTDVLGFREGVSYLENSFEKELEQFPMIERAQRVETVAYKASEEVQSLIYGNDTGMFKAWQLEDKEVVSTTLKTTYDELIILWAEPSKLRPGFKATDRSVYIPNLFAKINGTHADLIEYQKEFVELSNAENVLVYGSVGFAKCLDKADVSKIAFYFDSKGNLKRDAYFTSPYYKYSYLRRSIQEVLFYKVNELLNTNILNIKKDLNSKVKVLGTIFAMEENIMSLIEKFDYSGAIPKVIIFDNKKDMLTEEDAILLAFLNIIGFDIAIFTPTYYNNIEHLIDKKYFDIHTLEKVNTEVEMPNKSMNFLRERKGLLRGKALFGFFQK